MIARDIIVTLDIDWAPDWMVASAAAMLARRGVKATWFATHVSPVLNDLRSEPLFEVGLHPNFLPGSTHGGDPAEVMRHMKEAVPDATSVRTHSLCQSEPHLQLMAERFGIEADCSILLFGARDVAPHEIRYSADGPSLVRVPHFFQDNMYMFARRPWSLRDPWFATPGLKVFDFHPVHIALNSATFDGYERLKRSKPLKDVRRDDVTPFRSTGPGAATLFDEVLDAVGSRGTTIRDYARGWRRAQVS